MGCYDFLHSNGNDLFQDLSSKIGLVKETEGKTLLQH